MIGPPNKPGEPSLLSSLPPQAAQLAQSLTDLQIQQMHKMNQQGILNPDQQQVLRAAIDQMDIRRLRQRQSQTASASVINGPREMPSTRQLGYADNSEARLPTHHSDPGATSAPDAQLGQRHSPLSSPIQSTGNEQSRFDSSYDYPRSATNSSGGWNPNGTGYNDVTANYSPVFNNQSAGTFERGEIIDPNKSEETERQQSQLPRGNPSSMSLNKFDRLYDIDWFLDGIGSDQYPPPSPSSSGYQSKAVSPHLNSRDTVIGGEDNTASVPDSQYFWPQQR
ncbi:hypothetical protein BDD12DRAFT_933334 [Trichophaea hybrida]|nr:hypothetical protein BDD12DRAFT_933334 [Trichophaea hybrida]